MKYNINPVQYTAAQSVVVDKLCNGFVVHNDGTTIVLFNNMIQIQPGDFFAVGGNQGELYIGRIDLAFIVPTPAPGTITNLAIVTQKSYLPGSGYDNPAL